MTEQKKKNKLQINVRAKSPVIVSNKSKMALIDCNVKSIQNMNDINGNSKIQKNPIIKHYPNVRSKSPVIMSMKSKLNLFNDIVETTSEVTPIAEEYNLNENSKRNQESILLSAVKTPTAHPPKSKHLSVRYNLHSTPNTQNINKSALDSRIIMNLSPIMSNSCMKTNSNEDINCQNKLCAKQHFSQDHLSNNNSSIKNNYESFSTLKTNETVEGLTNKTSVLHLPVTQESVRKKNDYVNEKAKKCLFEKDKTNNLSNLDNDQDSLNISLDILEQVCQMSEMMDDSSTVEVKINKDNNKKNTNKLAFFLYGNNPTKLDDTKEEDEILQLALSMEDNLSAETKSKNKLYFEGKFTSLSQLTKIDDESHKIIDNGLCKNDKLKNNFNCDFLGHEEINDIGNTQMCEIADITEPLESFVDQWSQQYISNESNLCSKKKKNYLLNDFYQVNQNSSSNVFRSTVNSIDNKNDVEKNLSDNITNQKLKEVKTIKNDLNESLTISKDKTITSPNICQSFFTVGDKLIKVFDKALEVGKLNDTSTISNDTSIQRPSLCEGFSTAGGKSIKVSDKALKKIQSMLKDELNDTSTISNDTSIQRPSLCEGFSTAGGKSIEVSDKALKKVQSMLKDELNDTSTISNDTTIQRSSLCKGFSTAGGKSIEVSDKALQKVQSMLKDGLNDTSTISNDKTVKSPSLCLGFSTAGGKSITVSDKALKKIQSMLKDELNDTLTISNDTSIQRPSLFEGFSTAGGKSIEVSDKALKKVQSMLKDGLNDTSTISNDKTVKSPSLCLGFSTAGGKSIKVSDKALKKIQSMLKDELNDTLTISNDTSIQRPSLCEGFSTAGGKSIEVSDKALQKVQSMLKDELNDTSTISNDTSIQRPSLCEGFSTAGGKSIKVSDKALQKVQSMLKDELNELLTMTINTSSSKSSNCKRLSVAEGLNTSTSNIELTKSSFESFENLKNGEDCTLEDLSLIDTVEKFERELPEYKPVLKNKRPGSPTHNINNKVRKTVQYEEWEKCELKTSFNEYLAKKLGTSKVPLLEAVNKVLPKKCYLKKLPENDLIRINVNNALHLKLLWEKDYRLSDFSSTNKIKVYNFQDIKNLFLSHHIVDKKLISKGWIENHFCLIVWKLAATEISFPDHFCNRLLTAKNVTHQLLYRYYREIEKCQRSALKKVLEKDESAIKRIILCVSKVVKSDTSETYTVELTDGWYSVQGLVDFEMNMLIHRGIVKVGTKLMIYNAELIGAGEGIDPLSVHDGVKLKISTNSTRRVRWFTKLGFCKNSTLPIPISLESVLPRGGSIGSLSLVILRKYPMMYFERKTNSKSIFRNEKMEAIEAEKYKAYQQKSLELISNKIETELITEMSLTTKKSKNYLLSVKKDDLEKLSINELSNVLENSTDPLEIQSMLSQNTLEALQYFKKSEYDRFYNELRNRVDKVFNEQFKDARKVIPLFKLRVVEEKHAFTGFKSALLTIWNPSEDVSCVLSKSSEGQCCTFYNLTSSGFINGELQLSANKNTRFNLQGCNNNYAKRDVTISFKSILSSSFLPLFSELDLVGVVISTSNANKSNTFYHEIYVTDKEMNIISILFRGHIKEYGCDDMMYPGSVVLGINLHFRGFNQMSVPKLYNSELSSFTTIPKTEHLVNIFADYKAFMKKSENQGFLQRCQNKLREILNGNVKMATTGNEVLKPVCSNTLNTPTNVFHRLYDELPISVMKASSTLSSEFSPAQKRIKMLNTYGKTPPLNIVHSKPPDKKLLGQFKTPTR